MKFRNLFIPFLLLLFQQNLVAQNKRFCPEQVFLCSRATSSGGLGFDTNPTKGHCYKWVSPDPTINFDDETSPNPKLKNIPKSSMSFEVNVTTDDGNLIVNKINVFIYELKLEIFHSKIMDESSQNVLADKDGAQTFINIDNDDNDNINDISDLDVLGGDNELIKLKASINVLGVDFPVSAAESKVIAMFLEKMDLELSTTKSENAIKLWKFESKKEIFGDGKKGIFSLEKNELQSEILSNVKWKTATIWVEGIEANLITQGTEFELKVKDDISSGADCNKAIATATIAEVSSIEWIGMKNGEDSDKYESDILAEKELEFIDADNPTKSWKSNSVRVFPDGRYNNGVISASKDKVKVKITIMPALKKAFTLYVKSFDMDDPSQNKDNEGNRNQPPGLTIDGKFIIDPNDGLKPTDKGSYSYPGDSKYNRENDNRGTPKMGKVEEIKDKNGNILVNLMSNGIFTVNFGSYVTTIEDIEFSVSQFPGDNYALYACCDKVYLTNLKNTDAEHGDKIMNVTNDESSIDCLMKDKFQSKVLTVWRLLHLEIDEMQLDEKDNKANIYFTDFESSTNSSSNIQRIIGVPDLTKIQSCECGGAIDDNDNSANLSLLPVSNAKNGRFEKGTNAKIKIGISQDYMNVTNTIDNTDIKGNGSDFLEFDKPLSLKDLKCTLKKGALSMDCKLIEVTKNSGFLWKLDKNGSTNNFSQFTGGEILFGNSIEKFTIESITDNGISGTIKTTSFKIYAILTDDDMKIADGANKITDLSNMVAFEKAFIQCINDGGGSPANNEKLSFVSNIPRDASKKQTCFTSYFNDKHQSKSYEKENFWVVYVARLWQAEFDQDYDGNSESSNNGITEYPFDGLPTSIKSITRGKQVSFVFRETVTDLVNSRKNLTFKFKEETTIVHEIGHQFGLSHGDIQDDADLKLNADIDMGIMGDGGATANARNSKIFMPFHINLIRSRVDSPGQ